MQRITHLSRRARGALLVVMALCLVAAGSFGNRNPLALVWADRLLGHVFLFGVIALLLLGAGIYLLIGAPWAFALLVPVAVLALVWGALGLACSQFSAEDEAVVRAPRSFERDYEAVVRFDYSAVIDPAWTISIRQRGGPLAHEWLACYVEDGPRIDYVRWASRRRLVVSTPAGDFVLRVNPRDGFPARETDPGLCVPERD